MKHGHCGGLNKYGIFATTIPQSIAPKERGRHCIVCGSPNRRPRKFKTCKRCEA